jgi:broad specificity phosphatase PhoE
MRRDHDDGCDLRCEPHHDKPADCETTVGFTSADTEVKLVHPVTGFVGIWKLAAAKVEVGGRGQDCLGGAAVDNIRVVPLLHFVTHPEVEVRPDVLVTEWELSERGLLRVQGLLGQRWLPHLTHVFSSTERKALQTAQALADATGLSPLAEADLCENDRSSTGFLLPADFEATADAFFARAGQSVRGWETAEAAQGRIVSAMSRLLVGSGMGDVAVVAHGAVGALLMCHLLGVPIHRAFDQPGQGSLYTVDMDTMNLVSGWQRLPLSGRTQQTALSD